MTVKQLNEGLFLMQEITRIGRVIEDIRACTTDEPTAKVTHDAAIKTLTDRLLELNRKFDEL
jgi:hypothetical protein